MYGFCRLDYVPTPPAVHVILERFVRFEILRMVKGVNRFFLPMYSFLMIADRMQCL